MAMSVQGVQDLKLDFKRLRKGMSTASLRKAIRSGGKIVQKKAAQNAPVGSSRERRKVTFKDGTKKTKLSKSIRVVAKKIPRGQTGSVSVNVGWLSTAFHGRFIHSGATGATFAPKKSAFRMPKGRRGSADVPFVRGTITIPRRPRDKFLVRAFKTEANRVEKEIARVMDQIQEKAATRA